MVNSQLNQKRQPGKLAQKLLHRNCRLSSLKLCSKSDVPSAAVQNSHFDNSVSENQHEFQVETRNGAKEGYETDEETEDSNSFKIMDRILFISHCVVAIIVMLVFYWLLM